MAPPPARTSAPPTMLDALPVAGRETVLASAVRRTYAGGEVLVRQGDEGSSLYIIESGRVWARLDSASGHRITLSVMGPGDVFGEMGVVMDRHERTATVEAIDDVAVRVVRKDDADRLRRTHPDAADFLLAVLARRVDRLSRQLLEAHHVAVDIRLARRLYEVGRLFAGTGTPVVLPFTQEDIADLAGTTRPTANQVLKRLEADGVVRLVRGRVELLDIAGLRAAAR